MENSILVSIKKLLGLSAEYTPFDPDVIMHINSVFSTLTQLGVGPKEGFSIVDETNTWDQFISDEDPRYNSIRSYIFLKVKLLFDLQTMSAAALQSYKEMASEYEWRLNATAEFPDI